jgi:hypothetical protein
VKGDLERLIAQARFALDTGAVHFGETINYPPDIIDSVLGDLEEALAILRALAKREEG